VVFWILFCVLNYLFFLENALGKQNRKERQKETKRGKRKPAAAAAQPNPLPTSPVDHLTSLSPLFSP